MKTLTAVLAATLAASTASADPDRLDAISEGAARSNAGDHAAAIKLFEQAYLWEPDAALLPIVGTEYRNAGLPVDAIRTFCQYLATAPQGEQAQYAVAQVLSIRAELGQSVRGDVCAEPAAIRVDFRPSRTPKRSLSKREVAGVATAVIGLASLGAGLYYGMEARSISDQIGSHDPATPWPEDIAAQERRGQRAESREKLFLIGGAAALATAGVLYVTGRADRLASEKLVVAPAIMPDGGGISLARGF